MQKIKPYVNKKISFLSRINRWLVFGVLTIVSASAMVAPAYATTPCGGYDAVTPTIELGCRGKGNPIVDLTFAVIRFLSIGVGIVIVGSLIVAGIQYIASSGDPQAVAQALKRISNTVAALILFIFIFALLNWIVPGALLK